MKTYTQNPRTDDENQLFRAGYRVYRNENYHYFAYSPQKTYLHSSPNLNAAWQACYLHQNPPEMAIEPEVGVSGILTAQILFDYLAHQYASKHGADKPTEDDYRNVENDVLIWHMQQIGQGE